MNKSTFATIASIAGLMVCLHGHADVLQMPEATGEQGATAPVETTSLTTLPGRGMSMEQVEARFGAPSEKIPAVGEPPISRWVYSNFTVYFEHNLVLHSVTHQP